MKLNIIKPIAILMVLFGMIGIAAADPCPDPGTWNGKDASNLVTLVETGTNPVTYSVGGFASSDEIKEVCIASPDANASSGTIIWDSWSFTVKNTGGPGAKDWAQFGPSNPTIPIDGTLYDVGTVTWDATPTNPQYLVHVKSVTDIQKYCPGETGDTCFVRPIGPNPPVPELSPLILTSAGLLGIVLVLRKYRG